MVTPIEHYDALLAEHYTWMMGDFATRMHAQRTLLERVGIGPGDGALALDLGAGPGYQSIALLELGYRVTAVDTSAPLIAELEQHAQGRTIDTCVADMRDSQAWGGEAPRVVVCMGDTLTHLPGRADVKALFAAVHERLAQGGTFVLTYRDLSKALEGVARIFPVRADEHASMICFVEYLDDVAMIHDVVTRRTPEGYVTQKSAYPKLRLAQDEVRGWLHEAGFDTVTALEGEPMVALAAR